MVLILGILLGIAVPLFLSATRHSAVQAAKANLHMIARSAQAYRMKAGSYPADFTTAGATPPAEFVGSGRDLNQVPSGPRAVVYTWSTTATGSASAGEFVVTATESAAAADAFGNPDTIDSIRFNLSTGRFSDETTAPADTGDGNGSGNGNGNGGGNGNGNQGTGNNGNGNGNGNGNTNNGGSGNGSGNANGNSGGGGKK